MHWLGCTGYAWAPIARLLGRSRRAVRERFATIVPAAPPSANARARRQAHRTNVHESLADARRLATLRDDEAVAW